MNRKNFLRLLGGSAAALGLAPLAIGDPPTPVQKSADGTPDLMPPRLATSSRWSLHTRKSRYSKNMALFAHGCDGERVLLGLAHRSEPKLKPGVSIERHARDHMYEATHVIVASGPDTRILKDRDCRGFEVLYEIEAAFPNWRETAAEVQRLLP